MTVLIFPSGIDESIVYAKSATAAHRTVVGASSVHQDPSAIQFDHWEHLPFIHEGSFVSALKGIIQKHNITKIFTPHAPSYLRLTELSTQLSGIELIGDSPYSAQIKRVKEWIACGTEALDKLKQLCEPHPKMTESYLAALLNQSSHIYGECARDKIIALCAVFSEAPRGDIIEIGSAFGKSAFILNRLASLCQTGCTVAIDPWDVKHAIQYESPPTIQKISTLWDWDLMFKGFLLNLQASYGGDFAYIRLPSEQAWRVYDGARTLVTPEFGNVSLAGQISVLHIDGNHDEPEVEKDFQNWSQRLMPGGWIIFDDYEWSQGKGPCTVAERVKKIWHEKIQRDFIAGGAAFIQMKT